MLNACSKEAPRVRNLATYKPNFKYKFAAFCLPTAITRRSRPRSRFSPSPICMCTATLRSASVLSFRVSHMSSDVCLCGPQPPHAHQPRALPDRRALHHLPLRRTRGRRHHVDASRRHSRWRRPRPSSDCEGAALGAWKRTTRRSASGSGIGRHRGTTDAYRGNGARRRGEGPSTAPRERGSVSTPLG